MTVRGRSKCFTCGKNLEWHELVPLFSFIFQKGKCKKCKSKISWQYPTIEFLSGCIFVLIFYFFPPTDLASIINVVFYVLITCLLLIITIYDIRHKIIPDNLVYIFAILAFIKLFFPHGTYFYMPSTMEMLAGPILALPFALIWLGSKGTWMGLGDAKLVLGIGWTLGIWHGLSAITLAFWMAAVISVLWIFFTFKKFKPKYEIPFGPYLVLGMYIILFTGINLIAYNL